MHGHNWIITVYCRARKLNADGMVVDFTEVKRRIQDVPTAENIARWVTETVPCCYKAMVQETEGNVAMYVADDTEDIL